MCGGCKKLLFTMLASGEILARPLEKVTWLELGIWWRWISIHHSSLTELLLFRRSGTRTPENTAPSSPQNTWCTTGTSPHLATLSKPMPPASFLTRQGQGRAELCVGQVHLHNMTAPNTFTQGEKGIYPGKFSFQVFVAWHLKGNQFQLNCCQIPFYIVLEL